MVIFCVLLKKCPKDWVILHFWKAYLPAWYRTSWNFETAHRKRCCVYVAYAISFTSIVSLNSVPQKCKCYIPFPWLDCTYMYMCIKTTTCFYMYFINRNLFDVIWPPVRNVTEYIDTKEGQCLSLFNTSVELYICTHKKHDITKGHQYRLVTNCNRVKLILKRPVYDR